MKNHDKKADSNRGKNGKEKKQLPEYEISERCKRVLICLIPIDVIVAALAIYHPFIDSQYDSLCVVLAMAILNFIPAVGNFVFNQPRNKFVRFSLGFPLSLAFALAVAMAIKQDFAGKMRDEIVQSTNDLACRIDSLQRFAVRDNKLGVDEERWFAYNTCSALYSIGYTNLVLVCATTNGDFFCVAASTADDPNDEELIMGWVMSRYVPIAYSEGVDGDFSYTIDRLTMSMFPGDEYDDWRKDHRDAKFLGQGKLGQIGAMLRQYLEWLGVKASFVANTKERKLVFTIPGESKSFVMEEDDVDALIDAKDYFIMFKHLPVLLARQGFGHLLKVDAFLNTFSSARFVYAYTGGYVVEMPRSSLTEVVGRDFQKNVELLRSKFGVDAGDGNARAATNAPTPKAHN